MSESGISQKKKSAVDAEDAGGRHCGREVALQVLYAIDLRETGARVAAASRAAKPFDPLLPESESLDLPVDASPVNPIAASGLGEAFYHL